MSDIVIVTADTGRGEPTRLQSFLQGLGHTAALVTDGSVDATNLDGYDNIIALRNGEGLTALADHLRGYIAKGKWVSCGFFTGSLGGTSTTSPAVLVGMPGPEKIYAGNEPAQQIVRTLHPITGNRAVGDSFEWLDSSSYASAIAYNSSIGVRLSSLPGHASDSSIHLFAPSDLGITPTVPGGCGIYLGCIYNSDGFGVDAPEIMNALLAARPGKIAGTIIGADGNPAQRTVRAYLRSSGAVAAAGESGSGDGTFSLDTWEDSEHTVIALPEAVDENALVLDRVVPVQS